MNPFLETWTSEHIDGAGIMYIYSRVALATNCRHGFVGLFFCLLSSCYPISPLFHLVKHMASESAFKGMGLFLSLSLFPSVIHDHGMRSIPPFHMGKETNTVHVGPLYSRT